MVASGSEARLLDGSSFPETNWSLIRRASERREGEDALDRICKRYWTPIYYFVRSRGYKVEDAQELTQEFFYRLIHKNYLGQVRNDGRPFRAFLLHTLKQFLKSEYRKGKALKRGGQVAFLQNVDWHILECEQVAAAADSPDLAYDRQWARIALRQAVYKLERECLLQGKGPFFELIKPHLLGDWESLPYTEIAARSQQSVGSIKVAVHRYRVKLRKHLLAVVARENADPEACEAEVRYLLSL